VLALAGAPGAAIAIAFLIGIPVALVAAVYLYVSYAHAPASVVLEKQPVVRSLRRSQALVRGSWWRTFGILLLINVIAQVIAQIVALPFAILSGVVAYVISGGDSLNVYMLLPLTISSLGTIVGAAITWPFTAAATVLLYVDRRMRREGLDIELARAAGVAVPGQAPTPGTVPDPAAWQHQQQRQSPGW
jgi:hypothetical protein